MKKVSVFIYLATLNTTFAAPLDEAQKFVAKGLYQPAIDIIETEMARSPNDPALVEKYGEVLFFAKHWEKAIPALERAAAIDEKHSKVWQLFKAKSLSYLGRFRESAAAYTELEKDIIPANSVLWEHLIAAVAAENIAEKYLVLGKLASQTRESYADKETRDKVKEELELYEKMAKSIKPEPAELAKQIIEGWSKS